MRSVILSVVLGVALVVTRAAPAQAAAPPCAEAPDAAARPSRPVRADPNLELLALRLSGGNSIDQGIYERLVREVAAIRQTDPRMATIHYLPDLDGHTLMVGLTPEAQREFKTKQYAAWDCLNRQYDASVGQLSLGGIVILKLKDLQNTRLVSEWYQRLPGVEFAEPDQRAGDGPTFYVTRGKRAWTYVFDDAQGDCPAGCTTHGLYGFAVTAGGEVTSIGTWAMSRGAIPDWVTAFYRQYR